MQPKPNKLPEDQRLSLNDNSRQENVPAPMYLKSFTPAKTIKEANAFATNVLEIAQAEYKGCAVEVANE